MFKIKLLILLCALLAINACSLAGKKNEDKAPVADQDIIVEESSKKGIFSRLFGKKNKNKDEDSTPTFDAYDDSVYIDSTNTSYNDSLIFDEEVDDEDAIVDISTLFESFDDDTTTSDMNGDELGVYQDVIQNMQDEITKLKSELDRNTDELYKLKAHSQIWNNPFSIYNKEIILTNGSTVYGKIKYQDQDVLHVETLIGELTIQRNTIKRIIENVVQAPDSANVGGATRKKDILEIKKDEDNTIFKPTTKLLANSILLGDIIEDVDFRGNRTLRGDIKNIGEARADFVKINFVFRMNWQGSTKALTAFVQGSKHIFPDSNIESDSSIEVGAVADFELVIPPDFGQFIGYSYSIDWEQYDN